MWYGSADDYQLEHVDWTGRVTHVARWAGPDLEVKSEHLNRCLRACLARYDSPEERRAFERERWPRIRDDLPERFPAYESDGFLALSDGSLWVTTFGWRAPANELHLARPKRRLAQAPHHPCPVGASGRWAGLGAPAGARRIR